MQTDTYVLQVISKLLIVEFIENMQCEKNFIIMLTSKQHVTKSYPHELLEWYNKTIIT